MLNLPDSEGASPSSGSRDILDALDAGARVVTVHGPPGIGKTHLMREAMAELRQRPEPRVAALTWDQLAAGDGSPYGGSTGRRIWFLDDVMAPDARVRGWVAEVCSGGAGQVGVGACRRLQVDAEHVVEVSPLPVEASLDGGLSEAARFFVAAARREVGRIEVGAESRQLLERLVTALDGTPLMLEAAAERLRVMSLARLTETVETAPLSAAVGRKGTRFLERMDALLHGLSSELESALAVACSFRGAFSYDDYGRVWEAASDPPETAEALAELRDRSLVVSASARPGELHRVLSLARARCAQRLPPARLQGAREAHAATFARLSAAETSGLIGSDREAAVGRLLPVANELEAAFDSICESERCEAQPASDGLRSELLSLAVALGATSLRSGDLAKATRRLERLVPVRPTTEDEAIGAVELGGLHQHRGELDEAVTFFLGATRGLPVGAGRALALERLGKALLQRGDVASAVTHLKMSARMASDHGHPLLEAKARATLGMIEANAGDEAEGLRVLERARDLAHGLCTPEMEAQILADMGWCLLQLGRPREAAARLQDAITLFARAGGTGQRIIASRLMALALFEMGETGDALSLCAEVADESEQLRRSHDVTWAHINAAVIHLATEQWQHAVDALDEAIRASGPGLGADGRSVVHALRSMARTGCGDHGSASRELSEATAALRGVAGDQQGWRQDLGDLAARFLRSRGRDGETDGASLETPRSADKHSRRPSAITRILEPLLTAERDSHACMQRSLEMDACGEWVAIDGDDAIDLSRRGAAKRVLSALAHQRRDGGHPLDVHVLFEVGWPDSRIPPAAAASRVYVVINQLRGLGLKGVLCRDDRGYYLSPKLRLRIR